jgi:hypothetical protein
MRRLLPSSLLFLAVALPLPGQSPPLARRTLSEPTAKVLRERMGGEPFQQLAAFGRAGRHADTPAWLAEPGERDAAFHELIHAALWSEDHDTAYAAASLLREHALDIADIDRWLAVVWPHVFDEDPQWDWDTFKHVLSTAEVERLLTNPQTWFAEIRYFFLLDLHRSMRPAHIPALAKLTQHEDPFVRKQAWGNLGNLSVYTDQHRETIARALLAWPGPGCDEEVDQYDRSRNPRFTPRPYTLPAARPGWSPLLRAALERRFLDLETTKDGPAFGAFLMRWAEDEVPAAEDRLLLRALLDSPHAEGQWIALRAITRLGADAHLLRALQHPPERADEALVLAARHDWPALRELAVESTEALLVGLEFHFDGVWLPWVARAFGKDAEKGLAAIAQLATANGGLSAPYRRPANLTGALRQAIDLFADQLEHARLHQLVTVFPEARTEKLMTAYHAAVTPANLAGSALDALEAWAFVDFHGTLRTWAQSKDPATSGPALDVLLKLGDHELGDLMLAHWQKQDGKDLFLLARCGEADAVQKFFEERLQAVPWAADRALTAGDVDLLAALAMVHGLPETVARGWASDLQDADGEFAARQRALFPMLRERVLAHDPVDALVMSLATVPPAELHLYDLGLVDDDRVRELLLKVRNTPGSSVQWAIGELALADDFNAQRELDEMRVRHLYGWFDYASDHVCTMGRTLDYVPYLLGELETICCRRNGAASALQRLTGFDAWEQPEHGLTTQHDHAARWWREVGERLRWSELAQRYVVGMP